MKTATVKTNIRWSAIRANLDQVAWAPSIYQLDTERRAVRIGTVRDWSPTGKLIAPWTTDVTSAERALDAQWWAAANAEAEMWHLVIEHGIVDPNDLYIAEYRDIANRQWER